MASFYAELEVTGSTYPVRTCQYEFTQATGERGRPSGKVRHGLVHLTLDVPDDELLVTWGTTPHKALAGHITFFETDRRTARETLSFAAGQCVGYHEHFAAGKTAAGAYVCELTIAAEKLSLSPGGPPRPLASATPRDYAYVPPSLSGAAAPLLLSKQQRYDKRMDLMSQARAKLKTLPLEDDRLVAAADATHVAPGMGPGKVAPQASAAQERKRLQTATDRLARNNVAVERARLSEHVYHSDAVPPVPAPEGWHQLTAKELARKGVTPAMLTDPKSGFKAALYQSSFERPPKVVVAYAGTEDTPDWMTNLQQGVGLESKQYNSAMRLAKNVMQKSKVGTVDITGHSLGGGLASAATVVTGAKGYTFNAAGLHPSTVERAPYSVSAASMAAMGKRIDAYHSTADPLTNLQSGIALAQGPTPGYVLGPEALGVPHSLPPATKWLHEWKELVQHNPLTTSRDMALQGHGVAPQMVDHIEAQKDRDTATLTKFIAS
jgi:hypothetical protein